MERQGDFDEKDLCLANLAFDKQIEKVKEVASVENRHELQIKLSSKEFNFVNRKLLDVYSGGGTIEQGLLKLLGYGE